MNTYNSESLKLLLELPLNYPFSRVNKLQVYNSKNEIKNHFIRLPDTIEFNNGDLVLQGYVDGKIIIHITPRTQEEMEIIFNAVGNRFICDEYEGTEFHDLAKIRLNSFGWVHKPEQKLYTRSVDSEGKEIYNEVVNIDFTNGSYIEIVFDSSNDYEIAMKDFISRSFKEENLEPILQLIKDRLKEYVGIEEYEVKK